MGKVSPQVDSLTDTAKQKRRMRSSTSKFLRPGALAKLRYTKTSSKSCTVLGQKRVISNDIRDATCSSIANNAIDDSSLMLSPVDIHNQDFVLSTPRTPQMAVENSESRMESLPMDILVRILCHLHHDELKAVFHVSQKIRRAVVIARQYHFNYTTPDRYRQELLNSITPKATDHWPFLREGERNILPRSPHAPKAPRHGPRPPSRIKLSEMKQIAAVLFQDSAFPPSCMVPSALSNPICKSMASHRALFYEDELCQAVAENKLL